MCCRGTHRVSSRFCQLSGPDRPGRRTNRLHRNRGPPSPASLWLTVLTPPVAAFCRVVADAGQQGYQEQTGQTQTDLMDVILTPGRGDSQMELGADLNARCQLDVDFGFQCTDFVLRWFFDRTLAACSPFWYGGCGGNANRFSSEHECFRTCGVQSKSSLTDTGPLSSVSASACLCDAVCARRSCRLMTGGAGCNLTDPFSLSDPNKRPQSEVTVFSKGDHSLLSLQVIHQSHSSDVQNRCSSIPPVRCWSRSSSLHADACLQRQDPGGCQVYTMMWFFDTVQNECIRFWYGGCDGNANRFETQEECENLCLTHIR
ncbi:hypothetical protein CCH79_00019776 [Gambusia affinis]|uniref:BPTI/Kunitz inhibitor domain-containing protein n=1 Tax=Gambusia affinis TaxID=33528 RepID=A0A315VD86_GAMAF|nr:hypothetical protein CCH79_00019776 [Gambusia affinis]